MNKYNNFSSPSDFDTFTSKANRWLEYKWLNILPFYPFIIYIYIYSNGHKTHYKPVESNVVFVRHFNVTIKSRNINNPQNYLNYVLKLCAMI